MKTNILYFSGTGNSLKVARDIFDGMGEGRAELFSILSIIDNPYLLQEADSIGFVFPVYMAGIPLIVSRLIDTLDPKACGQQYIFAVATSGGGTLGALGMLNRKLRRRGFHGLDAGWSITMPANYTPLSGAWSKAKQNKAFAAQKEKVEKDIVPCLMNQGHKRFPRGLWPLNLFTSYVFYPLCSSRIPAMGANFYATAKCNGCRLCQDVCPVANISMDKNSRPLWSDKCQQCMACLQWCPQEAIELGSKTAGRLRYRHPEIKAADISAQRAK